MVRQQSISAFPSGVEPVFPSDAIPQSGPDRGEPAAGDRPFLGILMLESRFPRPVGDIGHPASFPVPTRRLVVSGATAPKVVQDAAALAASGLLGAFIEGARRLEREGAAAITTSCGFLVLFQRQLQDAVRVPVATSSLLLLPGLLQAHPQVGVLTISAQRLGPEYLRAAGVPPHRMADVAVRGVDPAGHFARVILGDRPAMDFALAAADVVRAAGELRRTAPGLEALVLECTNMPPYAREIEQATGLRAWSLLDCQALLRPFSR